MTNTTRLEPLPAERAHELMEKLRASSRNPGMGLALDERGCVTGLVRVDDPTAEHLLGDLDVHA